MSAKQDGGPAFPRTLPDREWPTDEAARLVKAYAGMSLRDYFAAAALTGAMVNAKGLGTVTPEERRKHMDGTAALLYEMADAMLEARINCEVAK